MQVTVDGHLLPLLPALDRPHVAIEVGRNFLPRIQAVFGWGVRGDGSPIALSWLVRKRHEPGNQIVPLPCNGTTKDGIRRQAGKGWYCRTLPFEDAQQMTDVFRALQANLKLEVFYE